MKIICGSIIFFVGLVIVIINYRNVRRGAGWKEVTGRVVRSDKETINNYTNKLLRKIKSPITAYRSTYEVDLGYRKIQIPDKETTNFPLEIGVEKNFVLNVNNPAEFISGKATKSYVKSGFIYILVGAGLIVLDLLGRFGGI